MKSQHHRWHSPALDKPMDLLVFGHAGAKLLVFPTSMGTYAEWADRRMHEVLHDHIEQGWIQMICVDQVNNESWNGDTIHPGARAWRHLQYDAYLEREVVPFMGSINPNPFVIATGASLGAYQAAAFGMRHPTLVQRIIGMSGLYDIKRLTGGYSDQNVYQSNPMDFIVHEHDPDRLDALRRQDVIIAIGNDDPSIHNNREFSGILWNRGIGHALRE
ncbi:MAG: alpha/beta hydrolase-fold protein, partial [Gemmatimonadota bacterium]